MIQLTRWHALPIHRISSCFSLSFVNILLHPQVIGNWGKSSKLNDREWSKQTPRNLENFIEWYEGERNHLTIKEKSPEIRDVRVSNLLFGNIRRPGKRRWSKGFQRGRNKSNYISWLKKLTNWRKWLQWHQWTLRSSRGSWKASKRIWAIFTRILHSWMSCWERHWLPSGTTFQTCLCSEQLWKTETVFLSRAKGRHANYKIFGFPKPRVPLL